MTRGTTVHTPKGPLPAQQALPTACEVWLATDEVPRAGHTLPVRCSLHAQPRPPAHRTVMGMLQRRSLSLSCWRAPLRMRIYLFFSFSAAASDSRGPHLLQNGGEQLP